MEIVPGIHIIDGIRMVNCYLVISGDRIFMIDTGWPGDAKKTINYIQKLGRNPEDIQYIILTHADLDHIGCAAELRQLTGARLAIHSEDVSTLNGQKRFKDYTGPQPLRFAVNTWMRMLHFHPVEPDIILNDGSQIESWQIIHTPGHTQGSICIFQPGKIIFVGDALRTDSKGKPRLVSRRVSLDQEQVKKSLQTISALDFGILFPSHGAPILSDASIKIRKMTLSFSRLKNLCASNNDNDQPRKDNSFLL